MVNKAISNALYSDSAQFHQQLYEHLLHHDQERLLRIKSEHVERFLRDGKHFDLLCRHYQVHEKYDEAVRLMEQLACSVDEALPIAQRVEFLSRAISSGQMAHADTAVGFLGEKLAELEDLLEAAKIQQRVYHEFLERQRAGQPAEHLPDVHALGHGELLNYSDLYNDLAKRYQLWELCLVILKQCRHEDRDEIALLWHHILARELPVRAASPEAAEFLDVKRREWRTPPVPHADDLFEQGGWIARLQRVLVGLGRELYGRGSNYVLPLRMLCAELEQMTAEYAQLAECDHRWVVMTMVKAGVPFDELFDCYAFLMSHADHRHDQHQLQVLSAFTALLVSWTHHASSSLSTSFEKQIFRQRCRAPVDGLAEQLSALKNRLLALRGGNTHPELVKSCLAKIAQVEERVRPMWDF